MDVTPWRCPECSEFRRQPFLIPPLREMGTPKRTSFAGFTARELQVIALQAKGLAAREIGKTLGIASPIASKLLVQRQAQDGN